MPDRETAGTLLRVAFDGWTMVAAYFPQHEAKARYFRAWSDLATTVGAEPFVLVGDLNTGNQYADRKSEQYDAATEATLSELSAKSRPHS
jgi:hypothetical protein